jgi:glutaredoxin
MKDIKIYTLEDCLYCIELKEELKKYNIEYTEFNITNNELLGDQIEFLWKCEKYPMVLIGEEILLLPKSKSTAYNITTYKTISDLINLILKHNESISSRNL